MILGPNSSEIDNIDILQIKGDGTNILRFHSSSTPQTGPGRHGQNVRLGLLLTESDIPSEQDRQLFFQQFGRQHSFLHRSSQNRFHVFSSTVSEKLAFDSLPVDYFYAPNDWKHRITDDQIRNILLCLNHSRNDFLIISGSLSQFPLAAVSSIRNHTIFSKELGLEFPEGQAGREATGKILRLLPYNHAVTQMNVEEIFREHSVTWTPDPCWPPREPLLRMEVGQIRPILPVTVSISKLNPRVICKEEAPALPATEFIPRFHKQKPLVFVWPMLWVVGGAERNAIEAMRHLKDRYHFVVITMERPHQSQGSLHHQLKDIAEAVYDLGELAPYENYLDMLSDLKQTYQPDLIWTANGSPWFSDNAMEIRELFREVPVVDQQVYDTTRGWILRYREPGVQSFDRFVAINKKIQETFTERFRIDPDRVDLIYHAVNTYRFDPSHYSETDRREYFKKFDLDERRKIFVFAGRLTGQKRPIDFLQLVLKRQQAGDDALFAMVGDGDLTPVVDEFIRQHDLKNLRRIPFVENMAEVFSIASGLILTSEFEGMPIVILEALCMGVPVLATDVGDVKLMLDEYQAGVVIPGIGDVDSIDQNYEAWVANLDNYRENSQANAALVRKRFSGETVAKQYAESWERARQENNQPTRPPSNGVSNLVSIIIPSYNHARFIKTTIDSVLTQSYDRIELIVIDDGSTDDSVKYLREITDPRYSFYCQENQGAHVAINRGLGLASGEYLAILNSDDAFHPDRIKELMAEFRDDPEVELLSTWIEVVDTNGQQLAIKEGWHNLEPWPIAHPELSFQQTDDFGLNLLRGNFVASTSNILMRRSFYNKIGGMRNLHFAHDWDFLMRAAAGGKCKLVPKPLLKYRVHESNTTNSNRAWMLFDICWVLAANLHRFEDSKLFNPSSPQKSMQNLITLYESINLQGNDKVFWAMRAFIQSLRSKGVANPEELLLEDDEFREKFMGYITV